VDLADARAVLEMDRSTADLDLLRRLASRYGGDTLTVVEALIGGAD
jgi:hypothetical protein